MRRSKILPIVFKFDIDREFESSDFGRPSFFPEEAIANFEGKMALVKDRFAGCEMRTGKYPHMTCEVGCSQVVTIYSTLTGIVVKPSWSDSVESESDALLCG